MTFLSHQQMYISFAAFTNKAGQLIKQHMLLIGNYIYHPLNQNFIIQ